MGRVKRIIKWLKKLLFRKKNDHGVEDWDEPESSEIQHAAPESPAISKDRNLESCYVDNRTSFSDISIGVYLSHTPSLTSLASQPVTNEDTLFTGCEEFDFDTNWHMVGWKCDLESSTPWPALEEEDCCKESTSHHKLLPTILEDYNPNHTLPPTEEDYCQANIEPGIVAEPCVMIISNFGNVAFEVNLAQEERSPTMMSFPMQFSVTSNYADREEHSNQWEERAKRTELNHRAALKHRCDTLKKRHERAQIVRQRKASDFRPHIHAQSLLQELFTCTIPCQENGDITTCAHGTTIRGMAVGRGGVAFEVFPPNPSTSTTTTIYHTSIPDRFSVSPAADKRTLAHGLDARMEKKTQAREFHLLQRRQNIWKKEDRDAVVRQRKNIASTRPTIHGESLLAELPTSPEIGSRSISRGGVAFEVAATSSPFPQHTTTSKPEWLLKMEQHTEEVKKTSPHQLACELLYRLDGATQNRQARLIAICEQSHQRERRSKEVRARKKLFQAKPLSHCSSLLCELPFMHDVEAKPPSHGSVGFNVDSGSFGSSARVPSKFDKDLNGVVPTSSCVPPISQEQDLDVVEMGLLSSLSREQDFDIVEEEPVYQPSSSDVPLLSLDVVEENHSVEPEDEQQDLPEAGVYQQQKSVTKDKLLIKEKALLKPNKDKMSKFAKYHKSRPKLLCYQILDGKQKYVDDYQISETGTKNLGCIFYLQENTDTRLPQVRENKYSGFYTQSLSKHGSSHNEDAQKLARKEYSQMNTTSIKDFQRLPRRESSLLSTTSIEDAQKLSSRWCSHTSINDAQRLPKRGSSLLSITSIEGSQDAEMLLTQSSQLNYSNIIEADQDAQKLPRRRSSQLSLFSIESARGCERLQLSYAIEDAKRLPRHEISRSYPLLNVSTIEASIHTPHCESLLLCTNDVKRVTTKYYQEN